jgi:hypothetical protein
MGSTRTTRQVVLFIKPSEIIVPIVPDHHKEVKLPPKGAEPEQEVLGVDRRSKLAQYWLPSEVWARV